MGKIVCKYINSYAYKSQHDVINTALLNGVAYTFEVVKAYSGKSSWNIMSNQLVNINESKITLKTIFIIPGISKVAGLMRYILSAIYNSLILLNSRKNDLLFYNFNNVFSMHLLNWINRWLKRKIIIVCHGELELLISNGGGFQARIMRCLCRNFYYKQKLSPNISYIVLGNCIIDNLNIILPEDKKKYFYSIDHPYVPNQINNSSTKSSERLKIGTVGELNSYKGAYEYLNLLKNLPVDIKKKIDFYSIGCVTSILKELEDNGVIVPGKNRRLDRTTFNNYVEKLDYILFFYGNDKYKLIASGAIFDAIGYRKPIIALENTYFRYLTNKYGNIGFLCKDIQEMGDILSKISDQDKQEFDFSNYYENLNQSSFSSKLRTVINEFIK